MAKGLGALRLEEPEALRLEESRGSNLIAGGDNIYILKQLTRAPLAPKNADK